MAVPAEEVLTLATQLGSQVGRKPGEAEGQGTEAAPVSWSPAQAAEDWRGDKGPGETSGSEFWSHFVVVQN